MSLFESPRGAQIAPMQVKCTRQANQEIPILRRSANRGWQGISQPWRNRADKQEKKPAPLRAGWMEERPMIKLTRLNNQPLVLNADLIKLIENTPDTVLTLVNGEKIVVLESIEQVIEKIVEFRRRILSGLGLSGAGITLPPVQGAPETSGPRGS
jgi:flagellar protein FlbD